jgi:hypothetical protein
MAAQQFKRLGVVAQVHLAKRLAAAPFYQRAGRRAVAALLNVILKAVGAAQQRFTVAVAVVMQMGVLLVACPCTEGKVELGARVVPEVLETHRAVAVVVVA